MIFGKNDKLVMIGDSITDCNRMRPIGDGLFGALGDGYVNLTNALLQTEYAHLGVRIMNMGISGNTVRDLEARWQTDLLDLKPDWVSIMIGINDVWRKFSYPFQLEHFVPIDEYEQKLRALVERTLPEVKGIVLMTPFYIEPNKDEPMRALMDAYGRKVKEIAEAYGTVFVDTQAAFDRALQHLYPGSIAGDRVHPNAIGHMVLAKAFLAAVGFRWS